MIANILTALVLAMQVYPYSTNDRKPQDETND